MFLKRVKGIGIVSFNIGKVMEMLGGVSIGKQIRIACMLDKVKLMRLEVGAQRLREGFDRGSIHHLMRHAAPCTAARIAGQQKLKREQHTPGVPLNTLLM